MLGWAEGLNFCVRVRCDVFCYDKNGWTYKVFCDVCEMRRMAGHKNKKVKRMARKI